MDRRTFIAASAAATAGAVLARPSLARAATTPDFEGMFGILADPHIGGGHTDRLTAWEKRIYQLPHMPYYGIGDIVNEGDSTYQQDQARLLADRMLAGTGWRPRGCGGNHEMQYGPDTLAAYAKRSGWALEGAYTHQPLSTGDWAPPPIRFVWASPRFSAAFKADNTTCDYTQTLEGLDATLTAAPTTKTILDLHAAVYNSIKPPAGEASSLDPMFYAQPRAGINALLAKHRQVTLVINGHLHSSPLLGAGLVNWAPIAGGKSAVACVSCPAIMRPDVPLSSIYLRPSSKGIAIWLARFDTSVTTWTRLAFVNWRT